MTHDPLAGVDPEFRGGVLADDLPNKRAGASIEIGAQELRAITSSGAVYAIPYERITLDVGGIKNEMIFCKDKAEGRKVTITTEDARIINALRQGARGVLDEALDAIARKVAASKWSTRGIVLTILGVIVALVLFGRIMIGCAADWAVDQLPYSIDESWGASAADSETNPEVEDEVVLAAVQEMVDRLAPQRSLKEATFRVRVIDAPIVNAYALPGGYIVLYRGLLEKADSPEEVAGVLAHEMAHVTKRHSIKRIARALATQHLISFAFGGAEGIVSAFITGLTIQQITAHSRDQEHDADIEGARMMHAAGLDGRHLGTFFEKLHHEHGEQPDWMQWMSTHPPNLDRVKAVNDYLDSLPPLVHQPLECDWDEVKARLAAHDTPTQTNTGTDTHGSDPDTDTD